MTTKLEKTLKREIILKEQAYIVTISPEGVKVTAKGKRKGPELAWTDFVGDEAGLATALSASIQQSRE